MEDVLDLYEEPYDPKNLSRWGRFSSERDFYRYARSRLRDAFPTLPDRSQFNRLVRSCVGLIEEVALHLALMPDARGDTPYRGFGHLGDTRPGCDAKRRRMAGRLR